MPLVLRSKSSFTRLPANPYRDRWGTLSAPYVGSVTYTPIDGYKILPIVPVASTAPVVLTPATNTTAPPGTIITSSATGAAPLTIQWKFASTPFGPTDYVNIPGATSASYMNQDYVDGNVYRYVCVWTNAGGSTTSNYIAVTQSGP